MKVVCISGKARSGKDTVGKLLENSLEDMGESVLVTHYADLVKYICKTFFGWNGEKDDAGRKLLQYVGTDVVRTEKPDFWVGFVLDIITLFKDEWDFVIIPDTRFPNEISVLQESGLDVTSIRVERPNFDNSLPEEQKEHPSETSLDNYQFDIVINNSGTEEDLSEIVYSIAEGLVRL